MVNTVQTIEAISHHRQWFQNRKLILGTIAVFILTVLLMIVTQINWILAMVLAAQIVLFILLFDRPIWAFGALIVGQLTSSNYLVSVFGTPITVRFLWTILAIIFLIPIILSRGGIKLGPGAKRIIIPAAIFFIIATISNIAMVGMPFTIQYLRIIATGLAIVLLLPAAIQNKKDLKIFALILLVTAVISSLVAIMQHYSYMGLPVYTIYEGAFTSGRTPGLSASGIYLSFGLPLVLMPMIALYFSRGISQRMRVVFVILIFIVLAALYFTYTRSGIYALAPALLALIFLMKGQGKRELLLIVIIMAAAFFLYIQVQNNRYAQGFSEEESAAGRLVLWQAGIKIALDHPILGIGEGRFQEMSLAYSSDITTGAAEVAGGVLGTQEPHNDFMRVWISFGTFALLAYLFIFYGIFKNFLRAYQRSSGRFIRGFCIGCFAATAAYIINAVTHNVMDSLPFVWFLGGLSIACVKLTSLKQPARVKELSEKGK